jgi:hypothetical protein
MDGYRSLTSVTVDISPGPLQVQSFPGKDGNRVLHVQRLFLKKQHPIELQNGACSKRSRSKVFTKKKTIEISK